MQGVVLRPQLDWCAREPGSGILGGVETGFEFVERAGQAFEVLVIACWVTSMSTVAGTGSSWISAAMPPMTTYRTPCLFSTRTMVPGSSSGTGPVSCEMGAFRLALAGELFGGEQGLRRGEG